jgi:hypothetical protein
MRRAVSAAAMGMAFMRVLSTRSRWFGVFLFGLLQGEESRLGVDAGAMPEVIALSEYEGWLLSRCWRPAQVSRPGRWVLQLYTVV